MTSRRPGQWPGDKPVALVPAPPAENTVSAAGSHVKIPLAEVRLVVTVELTGRYDSHDDVSRALYEQTVRASDCHTVIVRLSDDAIRRHLGLARAIAGAFFLSAQRIEIHVSAGTRYAYFAQEVRRELAQICADHEQMIANTRTPG